MQFRHAIFFICAFLLVSTLSIYWQVAHHDFINLDDTFYVTENQVVQSGVTKTGLVWAFTESHFANWHPLTWISHMLDCQLFGVKAGQHHLVNLLFHIANSLLLFGVIRKMTGALWKSAFVAALFALHPLHVESVAWVAERKDVLSTFFWLLCMWAYENYAEKPGPKWYFVVLGFFALGLMAKPMVVTLPFVLLLLDYWPLDRLHLGQRKDKPKSAYQKSLVSRLLWEKVPLFVLSAASSILTFVVEKQGGGVAPSDQFPLNISISNALLSYVSYIGKMLWPNNLSVFYPYPEIIPMWKSAGATLLLLPLSILFIRAARTRPYLIVGWLWYLGTLIPVIGLIQVGNQAMADRYTYIPLIGLFIMVAWSIPDILQRWRYRQIALWISAGLLFSALTVCTWLQVRHWKDSISLFRHALNVTANNYLAHNNLGTALMDDGRHTEAIQHYSEALRIRPRYALAQYNLGNTKAEQGKYEEAIEHYTEAVRLAPNYAKAHNNLANMLLYQGRLNEAIDQYLNALEINPNYANAHSNLGIALAQKGNLDRAVHHLREALRINPNHVRAQHNLEQILKQKAKLNRKIR